MAETTPHRRPTEPGHERRQSPLLILQWSAPISEATVLLLSGLPEFRGLLFGSPSSASVHFSRSVMSNSLRPHELQHASLPCPSPTPGACSNSCQSSQRCHPTISSSVIPFSSCLQSFQASRSFPMSQLFASGGQSIGVSASSISPSSEYSGLIPLGWTDWISLQSKGLSKVISNTTVQKHQFFSAQLSL